MLARLAMLCALGGCGADIWSIDLPLRERAGVCQPYRRPPGYPRLVVEIQDPEDCPALDGWQCEPGIVCVDDTEAILTVRSPASATYAAGGNCVYQFGGPP